MDTSATNRSKLSEQRSLERLQRGRQEKIKRESITRIGDRLAQKQPSNNNQPSNEQQPQVLRNSALNINGNEDSVPESINIVTGQQSSEINEHASAIQDNSTFVAQSYLQNSSQVNSPTLTNYIKQIGGSSQQDQSVSPNNENSSNPSGIVSRRSKIDRSPRTSEPQIDAVASPQIGGGTSPTMREVKSRHTDDNKEGSDVNHHDQQNNDQQNNDEQNDDQHVPNDVLFIEDQLENKEVISEKSQTNKEETFENPSEPPQQAEMMQSEVTIDDQIIQTAIEEITEKQEKLIEKNEQIVMQHQNLRKSTVKEFIKESQQLNIDNEDTTQSHQQIKTSKVSEYKNAEIQNNDQSKRSVIVDDVNDDEMDNIDSDDEGQGVPITKQSDIRDAVESNMSRANQFSTHKSMSIRETEEIMSNMKSIKRIEETPIDGNSPDSQNNNSPYMRKNNYTELHEANNNIILESPESPYNDPQSENLHSPIKVQNELENNQERSSIAISSHTNTSSIAPLLFVDVNLGPEHQERIVIYDGDTPIQLAQQFCKLHELDDEMLEQLTILLQQQMASILPKVEEEDDYNQEDTEENDYENQNNALVIKAGPDANRIDKNVRNI